MRAIRCSYLKSMNKFVFVRNKFLCAMGAVLMSAALSIPTLAHGEDAIEADSPKIDKTRAKEWGLQLGFGGEFFVFLNTMIGNGPTFKAAATRMSWRGHFLIGGGPSLQYSYLSERREPKDKLHQFTVNGDFVVGGGTYETFGVYFHLMLGGGAAHIFDGETQKKGWVPWGRVTGGIGGHFHLTPAISLGALVDVGFPGIVNVLCVAAFHVGKK